MLLGAYTYAILTIPVESRNSVYSPPEIPAKKELITKARRLWWARLIPIASAAISSSRTLLRPGFRKVVFAVVIMAVVLFYRQGIMGTKEFSVEGIADFFKRKFSGKKEKKGGV